MGREFYINDYEDDNYKPKGKPTYKRWTKSAIDCYNRGCRCSECEYPKLLSTPCRMKQTVLELVRLFGKPNIKRTVEDITKKQVEILYLEKKLRLSEIYRILNIDRFEFLELLEKYAIPQRKRLKKCNEEE
jgi:hypothetical protein